VTHISIPVKPSVAINIIEVDPSRRTKASHRGKIESMVIGSMTFCSYALPHLLCKVLLP
jgi:hypothetical protein